MQHNQHWKNGWVLEPERLEFQSYLFIVFSQIIYIFDNTCKYISEKKGISILQSGFVDSHANHCFQKEEKQSNSIYQESEVHFETLKFHLWPISFKTLILRLYSKSIRNTEHAINDCKDFKFICSIFNWWWYRFWHAVKIIVYCWIPKVYLWFWSVSPFIAAYIISFLSSFIHNKINLSEIWRLLSIRFVCLVFFF